MYVYKAYNLCIHSEIPLPELIPSQGNPDVIVRFGEVDNIPEKILAQDNCLSGNLPDICKILFRAGEEIIIQPEPGIDEHKLRMSLPGSAMAVLLQQRGLLVLHASSVAINNQAVAFMGHSGWGKSTLAKSFHAQGNNILTDDVMAVKSDGNSQLVLPAFPQVKMLPDTAESFGYSEGSLPALYENARKVAYKFKEGFQTEPLPLKRIYVLGKGTDHEIIKLSPQEAFAELVRHTRATSILSHDNFAVSHLHHCANLIKNVSICRFIRKPSLEDLPLLVELIKEDLAGDTQNVPVLHNI